MGAPQLPIDVDPETGIWTTDSLPMLYVPQHFFVNNHKAIEQALGIEAYAEQLYQAGYKSAWHWCEQEAQEHGLSGAAVFEHYMKRLSQRGWGLFSIEKLDTDIGYALVRLDHSVFVAQYGADTGRRVCYMFLGWFSGSLEWVGNDLGNSYRLQSQEIQCGSEQDHDYCLFEVKQ